MNTSCEDRVFGTFFHGGKRFDGFWSFVNGFWFFEFDSYPIISTSPLVSSFSKCCLDVEDIDDEDLSLDPCGMMVFWVRSVEKGKYVKVNGFYTKG